ncbi:class I adenylate-forming enzyme family protein [Mesorhizobium sp. 1B3]|uniref:class I adenylate-forming enzyme family protein n=1 Tax=Mesorhizobium sp. 1B3 TaxID=3243599 RepID=UPI003D967E08
MRVETLLRNTAAANPGRIAVTAEETRLSYGVLDDKSDRLASALLARGVRRGDRVVVFMENIWEMTVAVFAVLKAGAVLCPVNPSLKADGLRFVLGDCRPSAILTQAKYARLCEEAGRDVPVSLITVVARGAVAIPGVLAFDDCVAEEPDGLPEAGTGDDLAMIIYTSGSTGNAKGVMMTHANIVAASGSIAAYLENSADDVILGILPLSFTYGLYQLLVAVRVGARLVLQKNFAFPHAVLAAARAEGITGLPLVPTMAAMILSMKDVEPLPTLRYITNAAAALPTAHVAGLTELFPQACLYLMYGLTECARATFLPPEEVDQRPDSVGKAIPGTEVLVVDETGRSLPAGTVGELVVRGPHVMQGYWENPASTGAVLRPGPKPGERWLHTGDLFRTDAAGFLYFVGRKDDIVKVGGEKIALSQVEAALHACRGVVAAVVVGVPDPVLGMALRAVAVVSDPTLTERDVLRHCAGILPESMVPKSVEFRAELPLTASGKVSRRLVTEAGEKE